MEFLNIQQITILFPKKVMKQKKPKTFQQWWEAHLSKKKTWWLNTFCNLFGQQRKVYPRFASSWTFSSYNFSICSTIVQIIRKFVDQKRFTSFVCKVSTNLWFWAYIFMLSGHYYQILDSEQIELKEIVWNEKKLMWPQGKVPDDK